MPYLKQFKINDTVIMTDPIVQHVMTVEHVSDCSIRVHDHNDNKQTRISPYTLVRLYNPQTAPETKSETKSESKPKQTGGRVKVFDKYGVTEIIRWLASNDFTRKEIPAIIETLTGQPLNKSTLGIQYKRGVNGEQLPTLTRNEERQLCRI